jgi:DNA invertase Pin-like site-specific DNA recombinase
MCYRAEKMNTKTAHTYARFSTPEQEKGDSERRQEEALRSWAETHGFSNVKDIGVDRGMSAYHGTNISEGVIGDFIHRVEAGQIPAGDALLLESPDRFSRQQFSDCWPHFQKILKGGVEIHFTFVKSVLKPDHSFLDLLHVGVEIDRANSESANKSDRIGKRWAQKKLEAPNGLALTSMVPAWLKAEKGKPPQIIPDRAKTIQKIFKLSALGLGAYKIAAQLTSDGDKAFGKKGWILAYVVKILKNRAVLGEFQPRFRVNGKRPVDGDPIPDFFPAVITHTEWEAARSSVIQRTRNGKNAGRTGRNPNLFTGLLFDASLDNRSMSFVGKAGRAKRDYLVTSRKPNQPQHSIRYDEFRTAILGFLSEQDWIAIAGESESPECKAAKAELEIVLCEIDRAEGRIAKNKNAAAEPTVTSRGLAMLADMLGKDEDFLATLVERKNALQSTVDKAMTNCATLGDVKTLSALIAGTDVLKLKAELRKRISRIELVFMPDRIGAAAIIHYSNGVLASTMIFGKDVEKKALRSHGLHRIERFIVKPESAATLKEEILAMAQSLSDEVTVA